MLEDWIWYVAVPLVAYAAILVSALLLMGNPALALFGIGATMALLLFLGIHNAWDLVTYIAVEARLRADAREGPEETTSAAGERRDQRHE